MSLFVLGMRAYAKRNGLKLRNGTDIIPISVDKKDAKYASACDPKHCAAANALKKTGKYADVVVTKSTVWLREHNSKIIRKYAPEKKLRRNISALDDKQAFQPGIYNIVPPADWDRVEKVHVKSDGKKKGGKKVRRPKNHLPAGTKRLVYM